MGVPLQGVKFRFSEFIKIKSHLIDPLKRFMALTKSKLNRLILVAQPRFL